MAPEPYTIPLDPDTKTVLKMYLFDNVHNIDAVRSNIVKGEWRCAALKPGLVVAPLQVAVAANMAALASRLGCMVTKTIYGEILYNLSLSKNISQSLNKFGAAVKGQELLLCFLVSDECDETNKIVPQIEGQLCDISKLGELTNLKDVKTTYKLNNLKNDAVLLDVIVSRIATKNFVTH